MLKKIRALITKSAAPPGDVEETMGNTQKKKKRKRDSFRQADPVRRLPEP